MAKKIIIKFSIYKSLKAHSEEGKKTSLFFSHIKFSLSDYLISFPIQASSVALQSDIFFFASKCDSIIYQISLGHLL